MHFHIPKPIHGWRQFFGEVGIIVLGVLIALGAEQLVEAHDWSERVAAADAAMTEEVKRALVSAVELDQRRQCSATQRMELAIALTRKDWAKAAALRADPSFVSRRFWSEDAYTATVAGQLSDHFDPARLKAFAGIYTMIRKLRTFQEEGWTSDATTDMLAIPNLPKSEDVMLDQLHAVAKLNHSIVAMEDQGQLLQAAAKKTLGLSATVQDFLAKPGAREELATCRRAGIILPP